MAWEYVSPYTGYGVAGEPEVKKPRVPAVDRVSQTPLVYKAYVVPDECVPDGVKREPAVAIEKSF